MISHGNIAAPKLTRDNLASFFGAGHFDPQEIIRQCAAESAVNFADAVRREAAAGYTTGVDPLLDGNVSGRLELQIALAGILAVVALERALDIDRRSIGCLISPTPPGWTRRRRRLPRSGERSR
jgi:hypothetical protein